MSLRLARARMRLVVHLGQMLVVEVRVDLRSADVGMAEQFLHRTQVVRRLQQMRGERMAQHVRVYMLRQPGPLRLDVEHRRVRCLGKNAKLTPRLVTLLHLLMDKHGEVVEREALFKKVWETNYTGDTRTLDVHISWLRRAIELDPLKPKFLKTIRGVGYRLDA